MTLATHMKNEHSLRFLHQSGLTVDEFISIISVNSEFQKIKLAKISCYGGNNQIRTVKVPYAF